MERIDYYMDPDESAAILRSLKFTLTHISLAWQKANLICDKEKMAEWEAQEIVYENLIDQFEK